MENKFTLLPAHIIFKLYTIMNLIVVTFNLYTNTIMNLIGVP